MPPRQANYAHGVLAVAFFSALISVFEISAQPATEITDRVDSLFAKWDREDTPGAAIAIIQEGQVVYKKGYGMANLEYDVPITTSTVFDIASVSKQFGAMAIAMLVDAGKISLDDDIRTYIPEVPDFGNPITIRHLIHHTSGLRDWPGTLAIAGWRMDDVISFYQILRMVWQQEALNFKPGDRYSYSNTGYNLLAETVVRVTGKQFSEWMAENIFQPLEMAHSHFHDDHQMIVKNRAQAYQKEGDVYKSIPNGLTALASSSLFTTIDDLIKWVQNFEEGAVGGPEVLAQMHERGVLNDGEQIDYAFGNSISPYKGLHRVSHSGGWAGFNTFLLRFPDERFAVIVLSNASDLGAGTRAYEIADIYLEDRYLDAEVDRNDVSRDSVHIAMAELEKYVGYYKLGPNWYVDITLEDGGLMTRATGEPKFEMTPVSDTDFWVEAYGAEIDFKGAESGAATHFEYRGMQAPRVERIAAENAIDVADYSGVYYSDELETTYTVLEQNGKLVLRHMRHGVITLTPILEDTFSTDQWFMGEVEFIRDAQGRVTGFLASNNRSRNLRFDKV